MPHADLERYFTPRADLVRLLRDQKAKTGPLSKGHCNQNSAKILYLLQIQPFIQ